MSALGLMDLSNTTDDESNCGYIPNRIWRHNSNKEGNLIIVKSNCVFPSTDDDGQQQELVSSIEKTFVSCQNACFEAGHRCTAFSYNGEDNRCVMPYKAIEFNSVPLNLEGLFRRHSPTFSSSESAECAIIFHRMWQNDRSIFWQWDCDFEGSDIGESRQEKKSLKDCRLRCSLNSRCTHFRHDENGTCHVKNAPLSIIRVPTKGGSCGYIHNRSSKNTYTHTNSTNCNCEYIFIN